MHKILIIGSKGFIGTHCMEYFTEKKDDVYGCDIIEDYFHDKNYFVVDAVTPDYNEIMIKHDFDFVINCSGAAQVAESFRNPRRDFELNSGNVFRLLDAIRQFNPQAKYLNLSSAAIYGTVKSLPVKENHPTQPISPYGFHKYYAENICKEFHNFYGLFTCNVRIFSAYGPGLKKQLFWELHKKALKSNPIEAFGTGNETRDFIYITDVIKAIDLVMQHAAFEAEYINVANGEEIRIEDAVKTFLKHFKPEVEYCFNQQTKEGDPTNWVADISILQKFGYKPEVTLNEGLSNYCQWLKEKN